MESQSLTIEAVEFLIIAAANCLEDECESLKPKVEQRLVGRRPLLSVEPRLV